MIFLKWILIGIIIDFRLFNSCLSFKHKLAFRAIAKFIQSHHSIKDSSFSKLDFVHFGNKSESNEVNELLRIQRENISVRVTEDAKRDESKSNLNISSILLFDSIKVFKEVVKTINWLSDRSKRFQHLVYAPNLTINDINENILDGFIIDQVSFLVNETEESIELATVFMFTAHKCREKQFVVINKFEAKSMKWQSSTFFPEKYQNFYGCELTLGMYEHYRNKNCGPSALVFIALSRALSYKLRIVLIKENDFLNHYKSKLLDLYDFQASLSIANDAVFLSTVPHMIESSHFLIPPGLPYSDFEKMLLPFDNYIWIAIATTLLVCFILVKVVSFSPQWIQDSIFGKNIRTPEVNLIDIVLNGGQFKVPVKSFARFLLLIIVLWSLIIRTCYQTEYFNVLQADVRKPKIQSYEELVEKNFSYVIFMYADVWSELGEKLYGLLYLH